MPDPLKSSQQNLHSWRSRRPLIWVCSRRLLTWCHSHLLFFPRGGRWLRRGAFPVFHPSVKKLLVSKRSYVFPEALQKSLIWSKICKLNKISKHQLCIIFIYLLYFKTSAIHIRTNISKTNSLCHPLQYFHIPTRGCRCQVIYLPKLLISSFLCI